VWVSCKIVILRDSTRLTLPLPLPFFCLCSSFPSFPLSVHGPLSFLPVAFLFTLLFPISPSLPFFFTHFSFILLFPSPSSFLFFPLFSFPSLSLILTFFLSLLPLFPPIPLLFPSFSPPFPFLPAISAHLPHLMKACVLLSFLFIDLIYLYFISLQRTYRIRIDACRPFCTGD
jgi:hypothetical protein